MTHIIHKFHAKAQTPWPNDVDKILSDFETNLNNPELTKTFAFSHAVISAKLSNISDFSFLYLIFFNAISEQTALTFELNQLQHLNTTDNALSIVLAALDFVNQYQSEVNFKPQVVTINSGKEFHLDHLKPLSSALKNIRSTVVTITGQNFSLNTQKVVTKMNTL
jgi:hypothetical protein